MHKRLNPIGYGLDEAKVATLSENYEGFFAPLVGKQIKLLELGIDKGESLRFWHDYFENATIVGLDCEPVQIDSSNSRIHIYQGYQQDTDLLDRIAKEHAPDGFDIVIDDCAHIGRIARTSFWHMFQNHLKPGGIYAIEDWGTGYINDWPDGRRCKLEPPPKSIIAHHRRDRLRDSLSAIVSRTSGYLKLPHLHARLFIGPSITTHTHGMVGFIKEILDACCVGGIATLQSGDEWYRNANINRIHINEGVVIVVKSNVESGKHVV